MIPAPPLAGHSCALIAITLNNRPISASSHSRRRAAAIPSVSCGFLAASAMALAPIPSVSSHVPWLVMRLASALLFGLRRPARQNRHGGDILPARLSERIGKAVVADGLQRIAMSAIRMAVIDDDRDPTMCCKRCASA